MVLQGCIEMKKRLSWDSYFLTIVDAVAKRATCDRGKSGAIVTDKERRILVTGYVGSLSKDKHCDEAGHQFVFYSDKTKRSMHCVRSIHAEMNCLVQAAKIGVSLNKGTMYSTMVPCYTCAKLIVAVGIKRVVSKNMYHQAKNTIKLFKKHHVDLTVISKKTTY